MSQTSNQKNNNLSTNHNQGNWWLILSVIALAMLPPFFIEGEYGGADGEAEEVISEIQPDYEPWFNAIFEPASGEIEGLLFVTQGVIGAGVIGYAIGLYKGRNQRNSELGMRKELTSSTPIETNPPNNKA